MDPSSAAITRAQIIAALHAALEARPEVLAASLGGSDATGRTDEFSDVDLVVVVQEGAVESAFSILHSALEGLSPITHRWRLADPTWPGNAQEFLSLRDADPAHFIDVVVLEPSGGERFLEVERHGTPIVLFDRVGVPRPRTAGSSRPPGEDRHAPGGPARAVPAVPDPGHPGGAPRARRRGGGGLSGLHVPAAHRAAAHPALPRTVRLRRPLPRPRPAGGAARGGGGAGPPGFAGCGRGVPEPGTGPVRCDSGGARQSG